MALTCLACGASSGGPNGSSGEPSDVGGGGAGGEAVGGASEGGAGGGATGCEPGETVPCYAGPSGTAGVGVCSEGQALCGPDGEPGECVGQTRPGFEDCAAPADEDCDGVTPACTGSVMFTRMMSGSVHDRNGAVAFLSTGDVIAVGTTTSWNFEPYPGMVLDADFPNYEDEVFVVRTTSAGSGVFAKLMGGPGLQSAWDVAVDSNDDVVVLGWSNMVADLGDGPSTGPGMFVLKLDESGDLIWSRHIAHAYDPHEHAALAIDADDNILLTSVFNGYDGVPDFGAGPLDNLGHTAFVAKLDSAGETVWAQTIVKNSTSGTRLDIAAHPDGRVLVAGGTSGTLLLDGVDQQAPPKAFVVLALTPSGDKDFALLTDAASYANGTIAAASDGTIWVAGRRANAPPGAQLFNDRLAPDDGFVARYDTQGALIDYAAHALVDMRDIAVDAAGNAVVAGSWVSGADFGAGPIDTASSNQEVFVMKYSSELEQQWTQLGHGGDLFAQKLRRVAVGPFGEIAATGPNGGSIDFGTGPVAGKNNTSHVFIGVFAP